MSIPFQERADLALTRTVKMVFPTDTNHIGTLFGGTALHWMDEIAAITAMRFSRQQFVTVSLDRIDFTKPIAQGMMVELVARVIRMGRTSIQVKVELFIESRVADTRELAVNGVFTMVAVDDSRKPIPVIIPAPTS